MDEEMEEWLVLATGQLPEVARTAAAEDWHQLIQNESSFHVGEFSEVFIGHTQVQE